ncbi:MAG: PilZ domain-containing protein [Terriglobales bacterium]|jgi:hypothetical protein
MRRESALPSTGGLERLVEYQKEQRKSRRFALKQAALLRHNDGLSRELTAETENVSLHGVLLRAPSAIPGASEVEVELRLCNDGMQSVLLRGAGRVVRSEIKLAGGFGIAVAFDQPLTERSQAPALTPKLAGQPASTPKTVANPKVR